MLNHLLIIRNDPRLRKPCISSNLLTPTQGRVTGVQYSQEICGEHDFHSLHCAYNGMLKVIDRLLTFLHILYWKNLWGPRGDTCYNVVPVKLHSVILAFLNIFLTTLGVRLIHAHMLLGLYANILVNFRGCVLYTSATYTQAYTVPFEMQTTNSKN